MADAVADYEAVMSGAASLRVWCDDTWPEDTFSLEENRADLEGHIADARSGVAFGYTIWDPREERVLGSLYLEQPAAILVAREWPFEHACWGSRRGMQARRALLESLGMEPLVVLRQPEGARAFHLHARLESAPPPAPAAARH